MVIIQQLITITTQKHNTNLDVNLAFNKYICKCDVSVSTLNFHCGNRDVVNRLRLGLFSVNPVTV